MTIFLSIDAWIKSRDKGFYSIDYQKTKEASLKHLIPTFIKKGNNIIVVSKADNDNSIEKNKNRAAKRHFELLNLELEKTENQIDIFPFWA